MIAAVVGVEADDCPHRTELRPTDKHLRRLLLEWHTVVRPAVRVDIRLEGEAAVDHLVDIVEQHGVDDITRPPDRKPARQADSQTGKQTSRQKIGTSVRLFSSTPLCSAQLSTA